MPEKHYRESANCWTLYSVRSWTCAAVSAANGLAPGVGGPHQCCAATITPFHFDLEVNFFAQIEGEKVYHVFSPSALTESELERLDIRGVVNIGQVQLKGRDAGGEHVFTLGPGKGLHQPQKRPTGSRPASRGRSPMLSCSRPTPPAPGPA